MDQGSGSSAGLRTVSGSVAKVNESSITLDQSAGGVTLSVDSQTQVLRNGRPAQGISSIREGERVRASFDPASNRAEKIEIMGRGSRSHHQKSKTGGSDTGSNDTTSGSSGSIGGSSTTTGGTSGSNSTDTGSGGTSGTQGSTGSTTNPGSGR
jgi:hypothetical protein